MPRVKEADRKRVRRPKTRTGCLTCRIRRVKCDEARPACARCSSTGRKCDGYNPNPAKTPPLHSRAISLWTGPGCLQEKRAFQFFREITTEQLVGSCDRVLWSYVLVQAAHSDAGIRHAIVALGTLHEYFINTGEAERVRDDFALQQYNLAIRQYIDHLSWNSADRASSYIVACVLFICIELLQGHFQSALSLINSSVRMFYNGAMEESKISPWPSDAIETILSRLQAQAIGLVGSTSITNPQPPNKQSAADPIIPCQFQSVDEATDYFDYYYHDFMVSGRSLIGRDFCRYAETFSSWTKAFNALIVLQGQSVNGRDKRIGKLLTLRQLTMGICIDMVLKPDADGSGPNVDGALFAQCERVIALAESILKDPAGLNDQNQPPFHFSLEFGIVGPLYDIACGCRDPTIRRKAIDLLRKYPRREGLWDSVLASRAAERQMELEECAAALVITAADIPGWARISSAVPTFAAGERRAVMHFATRPSPDAHGDGLNFRQVIEW